MGLAACGGGGGGGGGGHHGTTAQWSDIFSAGIISALEDGVIIETSDDLGTQAQAQAQSASAHMGIAATSSSDDTHFFSIKIEDGVLIINDYKDVRNTSHHATEPDVYEVPLTAFNAETGRAIASTFGGWGEIDIQFGGKNAGLGYAEFGFWNHYGAGNPTDDPSPLVFVFSSAPETYLPSDATFTGKAFGVMVEGEGGNQIVTSRQGTAELAIVGSQQNLTANFGTWGNLSCPDCANASVFYLEDDPFTLNSFASQFYGDSDGREVVGLLMGRNQDTPVKDFMVSFGMCDVGAGCKPQ